MVVLMRGLLALRRARADGDPLGDLQGGRGHDVEVAGVRRQVVRGALDLEEHRHLVRRALGALAEQGLDRLVVPGSR